MPRYEFECEKCRTLYDIWSLMAEKETTVKKSKCPKCKSKKKRENIGCPAMSFGNPVGTDRWNSESTGHDYRFKHEMERPGGTIDQRKNAQEKSHVGPTPYREISDLNTDRNWGEVK